MSRYDLTTTTVRELLEDPAAVAIVERRFPGISHNPMIAFAKGMKAEKAMAMAADHVDPAEIAKIRAEIEAL